MRRLLVLAALLLLPAAAGQATEGVDATVTLAAGAEPSVEAPPGMIRVADAVPGERYELALALTKPYTTIEIRMRGFDVERPRQMVPSLELPEDEYPLFHAYPNERVWEAEGPARVFHVSGTGEDIVLRLGLDGPADRTLVIERDVTPPAYTLGEVRDLSPIGFYQETTTEELALADLQIRKVGREEVVQNPTPDYHFLQRFPIQGLDPASEYAARVVFTDWAGNRATSETYYVTTPSRPIVPAPTIVVVSPRPNETVMPGAITVRARIESTGADVPAEGIRLFFDKREVTERLQIQGDEVLYMPETLGAGRHSVALEVTDAAGGKAVERWSFDVETARGTPLPAWAAVIALAVGPALAAGRGRRDMSRDSREG